ncbi:alpha/beta-hydrolase [Artomyces pyxidatus]|uniref:Alpha/beta-hydrolase n=1 Tax=Artomyces pyxidatus TaxID=48021 RepID=A0ACB8T713_9AGAM|nr:alpha/beta-hydrolase [Artomyces pyxidatus]
MATRETVRIQSIETDVFLDVWLYKPSGDGPFPVVVAGPGMTVTKDAGFQGLGKRWAEDAGFASLMLDFRRLGASGGAPRNLLSVHTHLEDYRSVIEWARARPELFRADKIVVFGSAMSALQMAELVVHDGALAGGMAQCPLLDGYATLSSYTPNPRLLFWAGVDYLRGKLGLSPVYVRAVGKPSEFAFLNAPSTYPGFVHMFSHSDTPFDRAPNVLAPRLSFEVMGTRPGLELKHAKCPVLLVQGKEDDLIPFSITSNLAAQAGDHVKLVVSPGGHFDVVEGGKGYEVNLQAQLEFLRALM